MRTFAALLKTTGKVFPIVPCSPKKARSSLTMTDKETTYLIILIVLAACLFVSLIFNIFFMIDMYYHVWCYSKKFISRRRRSSSSSDSDSDSDIEADATPHQHLYTVTGRSARRSSTITMLNSNRVDDGL